MRDAKNLTVRLFDDEYLGAKLLAENQKISMNQLVKEGLKLLEEKAGGQKSVSIKRGWKRSGAHWAPMTWI